MGAPIKKDQKTKLHYCHCGKEAKPVMNMPNKKMTFNCEDGHVNNRGETVIR